MKIANGLACRTLIAASLALALLSAAQAAEPGPGFSLVPSPFKASPFSAAADVNGVLWISGAIGVDENNQIVPGGMPAQTRQAMSNIGNLLKSRGMGFDDVFKCTVMLADMSRWSEFNGIYVSYFRSGHLPARSAVGANGLSRGAQVEIECMALDKPDKR